MMKKIFIRYRKVFLIVCLITLLLIAVVTTMIVGHQQPSGMSGYIEANLTYVSTEANGRLQSLKVHKGEMVNPQQLLFTIDKTPYELQAKAAQYNQAANRYHYEDLLTGKRLPYIQQIKAEIAKAKANLAYTKQNFLRSQKLIKSHTIARASYDSDMAQYEQARSSLVSLQAELQSFQLAGRSKQIASAEATLSSSQQQALLQRWHTEQTQVRSPAKAMVFDTYYWPGEQVKQYQPVLSLFVPKQVKCVFFVNEHQLSQLHLGQEIYFTIDGMVQHFYATIAYISPQAEFTPPVIYSENSRLDLSYRIEAKIAIVGRPAWHPGQPVTVYLPGVK